MVDKETMLVLSEVYTALHYEAPPNWVMDYVEYVGEFLDHRIDLNWDMPTFHEYLRFQLQVCREEPSLQPGYDEDIISYLEKTGGEIPSP